MKKSVLLILSLLFGCVYAEAQTISYQPLHGNYTQYLYHSQHWNGSENVESFSKVIWSGDTTINGENYTRIFQEGLYFGGIREDVPNQKRFFIGLNNVEKDITIDHFLAAGTFLTDSSKYLNAFKTYSGYIDGNYDSLYVDQVDSILEGNGSYSATYHLRKLPQPNTFVFNTYRGLLHYQKLEYVTEQVCYREDGEQTVPGQETPWTYICDLGISENNLLEISISPNPSTNFIELSGKDLPLVQQLVIYDVNGVAVKSVKQSELNTSISLMELESGMYFLAFNGSAKTLRFVKQ